MRSGQHLNAETSFDQTIYRFEVPTDDPAVVRKGLQILQQIASDIAFDPAEVERERGVVLEERRLDLGANERLRRKLLPVLVRGIALRQPPADRDAGGAAEGERGGPAGLLPALVSAGPDGGGGGRRRR